MQSDRRSRQSRALAIGLGASVIVHLAVLGLLRFDATELPAPEKVVVEFDAPSPLAIVEEETPPPIQEAAPIDASAPEMEIIGDSEAGEAATSAAIPATAEPTPATAPLAGDPILPAAETDLFASLTEPALAVTEPALAVIHEAPEAATTSDELDASVPVWRPGSVGKAKRQWANNGTGAGERGNGDGVGIFMGRGGGHCPMPGRGRGAVIPPSWFR
jgi:hypothetical protein